MFKHLISSIVCVALLFNSVGAYCDTPLPSLPVPGTMLAPARDFMPLTLKGLVLHPENALKFDFIMDTGNTGLSVQDGVPLRRESMKIMKYFLTALTMPEEDLWVNLSPYEKSRIIEPNFGSTVMGRDLLGEDYILKQLTASLIYPEDELGKKFWKEVYQKAGEKLGTTQIPVNTFNKVWIVPAEAVVWEHDGKVMIVKSRLKVMLEEDYISLSKNIVGATPRARPLQGQALGPAPTDTSKIGSQSVRDLVLPVLEQQVNQGQHFAQLRQMYQAMILATWYKKSLKESILTKVYANQKKVKGIDSVKKAEVDGIYQSYLQAFKKGAFNYIKEDIEPKTGQSIPRKYFSGGFSLGGRKATAFSNTILSVLSTDFAQLSIPAKSDITQSLQPKGQMIRVDSRLNATDQVDLTQPSSSLDKTDSAMTKQKKLTFSVLAGSLLSFSASNELVMAQINPAQQQMALAHNDVLVEPAITNEPVITETAKLSNDQLKLILKKGRLRDQRNAIRELQQRADVSAIPDLRAQLYSPYSSLRKLAAQVLSEFRWSPVELEDQYRFYHELERWEDIVKIGPSVRPFLIEEFLRINPTEVSHSYYQGLRNAMDGLGINWYDRLSLTEKIELWSGLGVGLGMLGYGVYQRKQLKLLALTKMPFKIGLGVLERMLQDEDKEVRKTAALTLVARGWKPATYDQKILYFIAMQNWNIFQRLDPGLTPYLFTILRDRDQDIKRHIINILMNSQGYSARSESSWGGYINALVLLLKDPDIDTDIKIGAAKVILKMRGYEHEDILIRLLSFKDSNVKDETAIELFDQALELKKQGIGFNIITNPNSTMDEHELAMEHGEDHLYTKKRILTLESILPDKKRKIFNLETATTDLAMQTAHTLVQEERVNFEKMGRSIILRDLINIFRHPILFQKFYSRLTGNRQGYAIWKESQKNILFFDGSNEEVGERYRHALQIIREISEEFNLSFILDEVKQADGRYTIKTLGVQSEEDVGLGMRDDLRAAIIYSLEGKLQKLVSVDRAMQASIMNPGGVDLNAKHVDLQIKKDGQEKSFSMTSQRLENSNIQGFIPAIIDIKPIDLSILFGISS